MPKTERASTSLKVLKWAFYILVFLALAAVFWPVSAGGGPSERTICLSNLKQLGLGGIMYANNYDDHFPLAARWQNDLSRYVRGRRLFSCPLVKEGSGYSMSDKCSGVQTDKIKTPQKMMFAYDSADTSWDAHSPTPIFPSPSRHKYPNAVFADGHAKALTDGVLFQ